MIDPGDAVSGLEPNELWKFDGWTRSGPGPWWEASRCKSGVKSVALSMPRKLTVLVFDVPT